MESNFLEEKFNKFQCMAFMENTLSSFLCIRNRVKS